MITSTHATEIPIYREDISLSDKDILTRYLDITKVPCSISSPLRDDDHNPSFSLTEWNGKVFWYDFGTGEHGTTIDLMMRLWDCDYKEALMKMKLDEGERIPHFNLVRKYKGKVHITSNSKIKVKVREWRAWDLEYWSSYGISQKMCIWCNVYPISHAFFTHDDENGIEQTICVPMDKYAYAYFEWKDGIESVKLYQPFSQKMKWLSKHDHSVWDLWKQAFAYAENKDDSCCIITSSRKDAMCLWQNLGVPAMSLQGEGYIPKPQVMKQVLERFKAVYLWYDNDFTHTNDNPGQDNAKKLIELYPALKNICIPEQFQSKDPSDLFKNWGKVAIKDVWNLQK